MKKRYGYVLLFAVPGLISAAIAVVLLIALAGGVLWLFVFGDNTWPPAAGQALMATAMPAGTALWIGLMWTAYIAGRKQEQYASWNMRHVAAAAGVTTLLVLFVLAHQWSAGNLGPKSDSELCMDFCLIKGFPASSTPPRNVGAATCSCLDVHGREAVKIPMARVPGGK